MAFHRFVRVPARVLMVALLACASLGFSSCSRSLQFPDDARDALMAIGRRFRPIPRSRIGSSRLGRAKPMKIWMRELGRRRSGA